MAIDPFLDKIEEWVDRSNGQVRADVVHDKLVAMGFTGSERTTRRAVARRRRRGGPGIGGCFGRGSRSRGCGCSSTGATGPRSPDGARCCSAPGWPGPGSGWCSRPGTARCRRCWVAWTRPCAVGGAPTYALTDNEKTVTVEHIARVPVRHPDVVAAGRHYGMTIRTCVPADPQTKGGAEATVRIAKADLVPTEANLLEQYATFAELDQACAGCSASR